MLLNPDDQMPHSAPEDQGIASSAILAFVREAERTIHDLHSFVLLRHGHVVAEGGWSPYAPGEPHMLFSLSKSFTSTAVGLAVAQGRLALDDLVLPFFPDDAPSEAGDNLAAMRVRDLLTMTTGHAEDTLRPLFEREDGNWVRAFLAQPVAHPPGTHFVYNSGATYMLSAIVQRVTGMTLLEYLRPRLFAPLGIAHPTWESSPQGINTGGWGLRITTTEIARFGQLYLQDGVWQGTRILPEGWVAAATARQVPNGPAENSDWEQGYGYQFWRCRHGAYRGDGAFGQFCVVMPEQDAVLAITAGVEDMQAVLDLVWEQLLPAMGPAPLPAGGVAQAELDQKLAHLSLPVMQGQLTSPVASEVAGKRFVFDANAEQIAAAVLDFGADGSVLTLEDAHGAHRVTSGAGVWLKGTTTLEDGEPRPVAASGGWTDGQTYVMRLCYYQTPFIHTITCHFTEDRLLVDRRVNVSFGPTEQPRLEGRHD
jgi:CubicO group peptidase (beta-lactamase class C family)